MTVQSQSRKSGSLVEAQVCSAAADTFIEEAVLLRLNACGMLGRTLWAATVLRLVAKHVETEINDGVDNFFQIDQVIDDAKFEAGKAAVRTKVEALAGVDVLPGKRKLNVGYGQRTLVGIEISMLSDELAVRFSAMAIISPASVTSLRQARSTRMARLAPTTMMRLSSQYMRAL